MNKQRGACNKCGYEGSESTKYAKGMSHEEYSRQYRDTICPNALKENAEVAGLQEVIREEIASEGVFVEQGIRTEKRFSDEDLMSDSDYWNGTQKEVGSIPAAAENAFGPAATRKVMSGRSEEEVLSEYGGLVSNIFFDLEGNAFAIGRRKKTIPRGKERDWMSDGLLGVITKIEKHQRVPYEDFDWWVIIKKVKVLLEENKLFGPLEVIKEDLFVLEGRVRKLHFLVSPTSIKK